MKKIISFLSAAFLMSSFVFAGAANTPSIMCADDGDALVYHIDSAEEAIIELPANTAVTIIDENGFTTVYEYAVETGIARDGSRRASVTRTATSRTLGDVAGNATLTLWADATWRSREVNITDCGLNYSSTFCVVTPDSEEITSKRGFQNTFAKVRARGDIVFTAPTIGDWASGNYDFELWIDPLNMSNKGYLKVNDSSHFWMEDNG